MLGIQPKTLQFKVNWKLFYSHKKKVTVSNHNIWQCKTLPTKSVIIQCYSFKLISFNQDLLLLLFSMFWMVKVNYYILHFQKLLAQVINKNVNLGNGSKMIATFVVAVQMEVLIHAQKWHAFLRSVSKTLYLLNLCIDYFP